MLFAFNERFKYDYSKLSSISKADLEIRMATFNEIHTAYKY